jgi:hypothetical protein
MGCGVHSVDYDENGFYEREDFKAEPGCAYVSVEVELLLEEGGREGVRAGG